MMKINFKKILPYIAILAGFIVLAYSYTPEVLSGKIVNQADISSWRGMANEIMEHNAAHPDDKTLWTNSMFSGMPATSIEVYFEGDYTNPIYKFLFTGARPASYLLISLIGGFLLFLAFGVSIPLSVVGAIAITFCSYNMQIIQVGHNTKMMAIAFMPWVMAAIVYAYRKNGLLGAILFGFALSFQIKANHPQITYYLAIMVFGFAIAEFCKAIKSKELAKFFKTSIFLLLFGLTGIATNANKLIPTYEYAEYTMRGGSELSSNKENSTGNGLDLEYATAWSYGIEETLNLMIPNLNGGASSGELSTDSETYSVIKGRYQGANQIIKQLPLYWGPQPFTAGPMYMGAISIFLFVLGLVIIKGRYKWWICGVSLIALFLAWGYHFMWFSELFFKYVPLYNKFRTVSMILVILQLTIPILGILAVNEIISRKDDTPNEKERIQKGIFIALGITGGISLILALFPSIAGSFVSNADRSLPQDIANALIKDRQSLLSADAFRSLLFILVSATLLYFTNKKKIKSTYAVAILGLLIIFDLWPVDKRYLNDSHFIRNNEFHQQFTKRPVDEVILKDNSLDYRVLDLTVNTFNDSHVSYHHKTIGGYSPVKLQRYQDLIENTITPEMAVLADDFNKAFATAKSEKDIYDSVRYHKTLSMLNTKYFVIDPKANPVMNKYALGNAWFVQNAVKAQNADEEMALTIEVDPKNTAVLSFKDMKIFDSEKPSNTIDNKVSNITLTHYAPNKLKYHSSSNAKGLALFSEVYYPKGWKATIDGKNVDILRSNYILRALIVPEGEHEIEFVYDPESFKIGKNISMVTSSLLILFLLLLIGYRLLERRKNTIS